MSAEERSLSWLMAAVAFFLGMFVMWLLFAMFFERPKCPQQQECPGKVAVLNCENEHMECVDELTKRTVRNRELMSMVSSCCMVDEIYPRQCTDPRCQESTK